MNTSRKTKLAAAIAAALLAASTAAVWGARSHDERAPIAGTAAASRGAALATFTWPAGRAYTYGLEWTLETHAIVEGSNAPVDGAMDFASDLELRSLGQGANGETTLV